MYSRGVVSIIECQTFAESLKQLGHFRTSGSCVTISVQSIRNLIEDNIVRGEDFAFLLNCYDNEDWVLIITCIIFIICVLLPAKLDVGLSFKEGFN